MARKGTNTAAASTGETDRMGVTAAARQPGGQHGRAGAGSGGVNTPESTTRKSCRYLKLRLYVAGQTPRSVDAIRNLKELCEEHLLPGRYSIEVIDLVKEPQRARKDQIIAIPTLVRKLPPPLKKIIGDLSNVERVLVGLDIQTEEGTTDESYNG